MLFMTAIRIVLTAGLASRAGNRSFLEAQALLAAMRGKSPEVPSVTNLEEEGTPRSSGLSIN